MPLAFICTGIYKNNVDDEGKYRKEKSNRDIDINNNSKAYILNCHYLNSGS